MKNNVGHTSSTILNSSVWEYLRMNEFIHMWSEFILDWYGFHPIWNEFIHECDHFLGIKSPKYFQKFKLYVCYLTLKNFLYNVYQKTSRVVFAKSMLELGMISFQIKMNSF